MIGQDQVCEQRVDVGGRWVFTYSHIYWLGSIQCPSCWFLSVVPGSPGEDFKNNKIIIIIIIINK